MSPGTKGDYYRDYFKFKESGSEEISNFPKVTQLGSGRAL